MIALATVQVSGAGLRAETGTAVEVGLFSNTEAGRELPTGWEPLHFSKIERHTEYRLVEDSGRTVIRAASENAASGLVRKIRIDLSQHPIIEWQWKVGGVLSGSDIRVKSGDDYTARIYITFDYNPDQATFSERAKYRLGRFLFGEIPAAALNYIWENRTPIGTVAPSSYTDRSRMFVIENADSPLGEWVSEKRNVYEDYKRAFGVEPSMVNSVAIMTDTDNTGESAVAYYGDIVFKGVGN
jgi:hypothetical protein